MTCLKSLLDSIVKNTEDLTKVEVLIAVDSDDVKTYLFLRDLGLPFVRRYQVMRSLNFSRDYYTFLAKQF